MRALEDALNLLIFWMHLGHSNRPVLFCIDSFVELWCKNLLFAVSFWVLLVTAKVWLK